LPSGQNTQPLVLIIPKAFNNILGSDVNFDKWHFSITDDKNLKLAGMLKYKIGVGGFLIPNQYLYRTTSILMAMKHKLM